MLTKNGKSIISQKITEKWKEKNYQKRQKIGNENKWKKPEYRKLHSENSKKLRKKVETPHKFLNDIKHWVPLDELMKKYKLGHRAVLRNIRDLLGQYGVKDYRQARRYLNKEELLKDIKSGMLAKELRKKHKTDDRGLTRMIQDYLGCYRVRNYREAKKFLKNKDFDKILKKYINN